MEGCDRGWMEVLGEGSAVWHVNVESCHQVSSGRYEESSKKGVLLSLYRRDAPSEETLSDRKMILSGNVHFYIKSS